MWTYPGLAWIWSLTWTWTQTCPELYLGLSWPGPEIDVKPTCSGLDLHLEQTWTQTLTYPGLDPDLSPSHVVPVPCVLRVLLETGISEFMHHLTWKTFTHQQSVIVSVVHREFKAEEEAPPPSPGPTSHLSTL